MMTTAADSRTTERKVADTILQRPFQVTVGNKTYTVAPPSTATLILASAAISELPAVTLDAADMVGEAFRTAKDCRGIGLIIATLILGAKAVNAPVRLTIRRDHYILNRFRVWRKEYYNTTRGEMLAQELLEDLTPRQLQQLLADLLKRMEIGDFFGVTTFLLGLNVTRETKVETNSARTAPGA